MGVTTFQKNPEIFFKNPEIDTEYFWVCILNWGLQMYYHKSQAMHVDSSQRGSAYNKKMPIYDNVASRASTPLYKVYQTLFGTNSLLCSTMTRYLSITKREYLYFILTYVLSCKKQQFVATMLSSLEINKNFIMPNNEYNTL